MESSTVIKVKYGETLRRFNAIVVGNELDLDMDGLREKVIRLFNFASDADLTLTYIDEDGDVVTLVEEEDLRDVMRQSLNPLRITVRLNTDKSGRSYTRSSGSSTPMRSPRVQHPLQNLNSVSEILKSIPEPSREALSKLSLDLASKAKSSAPGLAEFLREAFSKLSPDLASKASSSSPGLAELVDLFSKMGLSYPNLVSDFKPGTESSTQGGASGSSIKDPEDSKIGETTSEVLGSAKSEVPTVKNNQVFPNAKSGEPTSKNTEVDLGNVTKGMEASALPAASVNSGLPGDSFLFGYAPMNPTPGAFHVADSNKEEVAKKLSGKSKGLAFVSATPNATIVPACDDIKETKKSSDCPIRQKAVGVGTSTSSLDDLKHGTSHTTDFFGGKSTKFRIDSENPSGAHFDLNLLNECPFTRMPLVNDSAVPPPHYGPRVVPFKRSYSNNDGMGSIFHRGVRCDGCGVHPITGPRFKSKVKEDYDLCSICFAEMGNEADYIKMDRPVSFRHPVAFKGSYDPMHHSRVRPPTLPQVLRSCGVKPSRSKIDSRFIQDVNVLDGTIMAPSTPFTKIWRMRNIGTIMWPQGTQLVWIGGDRLSDRLSVELEISADGFPMDKELDIAVDFTAPKLPGRYISYWRMASPSGQKFGQRVWVLIQVDASLKDSVSESFHGLNLNLPPVSSGITGPEIINVNVEPMVDNSLPVPDNSSRATQFVEPVVDTHRNREQELNFPINDTLLVGGGVSSPVPSEAISSVSYPIIDLSDVAPAMAFPAPSPATNVLVSAQRVGEKNDVEQTLLKELEEMGFRQVDLNKEILRMNEYDLEQSVDDLCGVAEWDPILEELVEMGFSDKEMNKKLLKKNNGSIKRVVMDLIAGEKA